MGKCCKGCVYGGALVGWVSRLSHLLGVTRCRARRNPPLALRVRLLGGLRAALLAKLNCRAVSGVAHPPYELRMRVWELVGWVSRLSHLLGVTRCRARRNPPLALRIRLPGGLRAALLARLDDRAVFCGANPPYELRMRVWELVGWVSRLSHLLGVTRCGTRRNPPLV